MIHKRLYFGSNFLTELESQTHIHREILDKNSFNERGCRLTPTNQPKRSQPPIFASQKSSEFENKITGLKCYGIKKDASAFLFTLVSKRTECYVAVLFFHV